jgi:hypothetical protein
MPMEKPPKNGGRMGKSTVNAALKMFVAGKITELNGDINRRTKWRY